MQKPSLTKIKSYILENSFYRHLFLHRKNDFIHEENLIIFIYKNWIEHSTEELDNFSKWLLQGEVQLVP